MTLDIMSSNDTYPLPQRVTLESEFRANLPREDGIAERRAAEKTITHIARKNGDTRPVRMLMGELVDLPSSYQDPSERQ